MARRWGVTSSIAPAAALKTAGIALLVWAGCFLGASADIPLRFPGLGAAIVFPSYAILTAALWRTPPRRWWIMLLAASAGNFVPHRHGGADVTFVLAAEGVNHLRALLAAIGLRLFAARSSRFDSLRDMTVYLAVVVIFAPALAAFAGAGLVVWRGTVHPFSLAWEEWALSNALTGLTFLPVFMIGASTAGARPGLTARRMIEGCLLLVGVLALGAWVFLGSFDRFSAYTARLYWPLPFLLWAAVRCGPKWTSGALLGVSWLAILGALERRGPFVAQPPLESLLELQLFLLAVSVPLLLLAALLKQQQRTAAALLESQRQYQSVVEDQTEMICRFRPDGTYTFVNGAYCIAVGRPAHELIGGSIWRLGPPDAHRSAQELAETITPASPVAPREISVALAGRGARWQQWRDRGFFDARGRIIEYQSVGRDVTDRREAEDERRQLDAQKSVALALRDADRRKDEFIGMLSHELRNPLASIAVSLEVTRRASAHPRGVAWANEAIGRQVQHLTRLVDDLLDISRITLGKINLHLGAVNLGSVVENAIDATRPLIDSLGHRLVVEVPAVPVLLRGDAVRLTQVVVNLLNNAAKYTAPGGQIRVALRREPHGVRLSVRDNGIGIAPSALARIFEPFTQISASRGAGAEGGLGIGLTLVKRLVELHGGSVEATSGGEGQGSELALSLPLPHPSVSPEPDVEREGRSDHAARRVLIADDNADAAEGLRHLLALQSHDVEVVHDGAQALDAVSRRDPDVVLLDIGLPILDGLEVARRIRERHGALRPLLVAVTGLGRPEDLRRSAAAGFDHHLIKPIDLRQLEALLEAESVLHPSPSSL